MNLDRRTRGNPKTAEAAEAEAEPLAFEAPFSNSDFAKEIATAKPEAEVAPETQVASVAPETSNQSSAVGQTNAAAPQAAQSGAVGSDIPAWARKPHVGRTLKEGAEGDDVKALQTALGIEATGTFDAATKKAVEAFQAKKSLGKKPDGIAGSQTLGALGLRDDFRSKHHKEDAFIPTYRVTAQAESDIYRTKDDPYAVGAITNPRQEDDDGGKTYGTYQFESYVYRDGSQKSKGAVAGSTLMRFIQWEGNPYGAELQKVVTAHGVGSAEFDAKWKELTTKDNKAFGKAQELFLEHDVADDVEAFFDRAGASQTARTDADLYDVAIGTRNQYGNLTNGMADAVAGKQTEAKKTSKQDFSADELGRVLQDEKDAKVATHFKSSPNAHAGIRERIARERNLFE